MSAKEPGGGTGEHGAGRQFVTQLASMEHQVGEHVITALQQAETVAVLTMVALGADGRQRIVSVGLDPPQLEQVRGLLEAASEERVERVPCVGFHCAVRDPMPTEPGPGPVRAQRAGAGAGPGAEKEKDEGEGET